MAGGKKKVDVDAYCQAVCGATETFKEGHRATSTALEHDMYMRLINCWAERSGFGTFVVGREDARGEPPTVRAAVDERTGELMVLKPPSIDIRAGTLLWGHVASSERLLEPVCVYSTHI